MDNSGGKHNNDNSVRPITKKDAVEFGEIVEQIKTGVGSLKNRVAQLSQEISGLDTEGGNTLLEAKNYLLFSYNINLMFFMLKKLKGETIHGSQIQERLVYLKTMLEKIRPLEQKIAYQVQKAVQTASMSRVSEAALRPRPDALLAQEEDGQEEGSEGDVEISSDDENYQGVEKYKAPLSDPHQMNKEIRKERKRKESSRKHLARSALLQEMRQEMLDLPEEVFEQEDRGTKLLDEEREIEEFEQENFKRVTLTKEQKLKLKKLRKVAKEKTRASQGLDGLSLGDITAALRDDEKEEEQAELGRQKELSQFIAQHRESKLKPRKAAAAIADPMDEQITSSDDENPQGGFKRTQKQIVDRPRGRGGARGGSRGRGQSWRGAGRGGRGRGRGRGRGGRGMRGKKWEFKD